LASQLKIHLAVNTKDNYEQLC